jgi:hypothetical protein
VAAYLVMAGLVPAISMIWHCAIMIEVAGTTLAMTPRVLHILHKTGSMIRCTGIDMGRVVEAKFPQPSCPRKRHPASRGREPVFAGISQENVAVTRSRIVPAGPMVAFPEEIVAPDGGRGDGQCECTKFAHLPLAVRISMLTSWRRNPMLCVPRSGTSPDYRAGQAFHRRRSVGRHRSV